MARTDFRSLHPVDTARWAFRLRRPFLVGDRVTYEAQEREYIWFALVDAAVDRRRRWADIPNSDLWVPS